jgi:hypothetical protein
MGTFIKDLPAATLPLASTDLVVVEQTDAQGNRRTRRASASDVPNSSVDWGTVPTGRQVQHRRGTTAAHSTFTGAVGEVTVDTDKHVPVVHDGSTVGGFPTALLTEVISRDATVAATAAAALAAEVALLAGTGSGQGGVNLGIQDTGSNYPQRAKNVEAILAALGSVKSHGVGILAAKYMTGAQLADVTSHTGSIDVAAAIQSAINEAAAIAGTSIVLPYDTVRTQGCDVILPPGKMLWSATVELKEGVHLLGAGRTSTIITSAFNGEIFRNATPGNYDAFGMGASGFTIIGDRTKASQIGVSILRDWFGKYEDITVLNCGSHGWVLYQCIGTEVNRPEVLQCVGRGFMIQDGVTSWATRTATNLPSNGVVVRNVHSYGNDAAGIYLGRSGSGFGVMGCQFIGGSAEYNYKSSAAGTGYNIELVNTNSAVPNTFDGVWCEDNNTLAHVLVNLAATGEVVVFKDFHHFGSGAAAWPAKAINIVQGTCDIDGAYGSGALYRTTLGTNCPVQVTKAAGIVRGRGILGAGIASTAPVVADETGATTGLEGNVKIDNVGTVWGERRWFTDNGEAGPSFFQTGQSFAYARMSTFSKGMEFGPGTAAPDAGITRSAANVLAMMSGDSFQVGGIAGETLKVAAGTANAAVAVAFGAVGPTGSTAGNPQGWFRINVAGTDRFIPYW